jgi:hypothetical protein
MIFSPGRQPDRILVPTLNRMRGAALLVVGDGTGGDVGALGVVVRETEGDHQFASECIRLSPTTHILTDDNQ